MFSKGKKTVSLEYKNKLLAEIEYYDKRISEALQRNSSKPANCIDNVESSDEDDSNPYTLNIHPSVSKLRKQEASLESRVGMTLELAMLTIMHSDNANIMTEPPVVRRPVNEDGTWLEVTADCRIDLVSFVITFYAHKPYRKFAPTRYRNVEVRLSKMAHEKELGQSILSKLNRPNLALQVLQSYAAAFRSRRTTLLDLAQKYADKIRMEEMAGGGYRVKFLDLLTVDWSLENMWSPVVPFCHRMKFEVEYMPKEYIHTIGRLYKQFKDPSLETAERTHVLSQILDTCLLAREPPTDLQESADSEADAASLHERRTTIDQEPDVPSSYQSPKKSKGKENKAQNRKTAMEPPKTLPKKVKKTRPHSEVGEEMNAKKSKLNDTEVTSDSRIAKNANDKNVTSDSRVDVTKKNKPNDKEEMAESRKGVKRGIENSTHSKAKRIRSENDIEINSKSTGDKVKAGNTEDINHIQNAKNNASIKNQLKEITSAKNHKDDTNKKVDLKSSSTNSLRNKVADDEVVNENSTIKIANSIDKGSIGSVKVAKKSDKNDANSKDVEEQAGLKKTSNKKDKTERNDAANSIKSSAEVNKEAVTSKKVNNKIESKEGNPKKKTDDATTKAVAKNKHVLKENVNKNVNKVVTRKSNIIDKTTEDHNKIPERNVPKNVTKKLTNTKVVSNSKNANDKETVSKNVKQTEDNDPKKVINAVKSKVNAVKKIASKQVTKPKVSNDQAKRKVGDNIPSNNNTEVPKENVDKTKKSKNNNGTFTQTTDKTFTKPNDANKDQLNKEPIKNAVKNKLETNSVATKSVKNPNERQITTQNKIQSFFAKKQPAKSVAGNFNNDKNKKMTEDNGPKVNKVKENIKTANKETKSNPKEKKDDTKTSSNTQNNLKIAVKNTKTNAEKGAFQKFTENQLQMVAKLKSKIPMIKSKIKISTLANRVEKNSTTKSAEKKTKIPLKSLPVFKKTNNPTRISPRKIPSFKPPKGVSRK